MLGAKGRERERGRERMARIKQRGKEKMGERQE